MAVREKAAMAVREKAAMVAKEKVAMEAREKAVIEKAVTVEVVKDLQEATDKTLTIDPQEERVATAVTETDIEADQAQEPKVVTTKVVKEEAVSVVAEEAVVVNSEAEVVRDNNNTEFEWYIGRVLKT